MDRFNCSREKNGTTIVKMDGCNRCRQITDFIQYIHSWNQGGIIISNYDISWQQFLFCKDSRFERMRRCSCSIVIQKWSFIEWVAATGIANELNTFQMLVKYIVYTKFMAASALLKSQKQKQNKRYKICPKFTINTIESWSGVFTVTVKWFSSHLALIENFEN